MIRLTEGRELLSSQGSWKRARVISQGGRKEAKSYSCIPPAPGAALRGPSSRAVNLDLKQKFNQSLVFKEMLDSKYMHPGVYIWRALAACLQLETWSVKIAQEPRLV